MLRFKERIPVTLAPFERAKKQTPAFDPEAERAAAAASLAAQAIAAHDRVDQRFDRQQAALFRARMDAHGELAAHIERIETLQVLGIEVQVRDESGATEH